MKHIHCDLIKAWADGTKIQVKGFDDAWYDIQVPGWDPDAEYRIKPTLRYRVALMQTKNTPYIRTAFDKNNFLEKSSSFVKWLTDWVEVEL